MKKLMLITLVVMGVGLASAQSKIAHVNSIEIMGKLPLYQEAVLKLQNFEKNAYDELQTMKTNFNNAIQAYSQKMQTGTLTPTEQQQEEQKLAKQEQDLMERQQSLQTEIQQYSDELNAPILAKFEKAVNIVADRNGYDYVFEESTTLIHRGPDITDEVNAEIIKL